VSEYSIALEKQLEIGRWLRDAGRVSYLADYFGDSSDRSTMKILTDYLPIVLDGAEPFYWAPQFCSLLEGMAGPPDNWAWDYGDMVSDLGFAWFANPLALPAGNNPARDDRIAAIAWSTGSGSVPALFQPESETADCALFTFRYARDSERRLTATVAPSTWLMWRRDQPIGAILEQARMDPADAKASAIDRQRTDLCIRYFARALTFMRERILVAPKEAVDRATRKRVAALRSDPVVRVVKLRRMYASSETQAHPDAREWACQWIVRGHWRQQWYPKLGRHQPKWITPYVKGPEDRPLKQPRATVFAVVR
jgi:hypothetical protein